MLSIFGNSVNMVPRKVRNRVLYLWILKLRRLHWFRTRAFEKQKSIKHKGKVLNLIQAREILQGGNEFLKEGLAKVIEATEKKRPVLKIFQDTSFAVMQCLVIRAHSAYSLEGKGQFEISALLMDPDVPNSELVKLIGTGATEKLGDTLDTLFPCLRGMRTFQGKGDNQASSVLLAEAHANMRFEEHHEDEHNEQILQRLTKNTQDQCNQS